MEYSFGGGLGRGEREADGLPRSAVWSTALVVGFGKASTGEGCITTFLLMNHLIVDDVEALEVLAEDPGLPRLDVWSTGRIGPWWWPWARQAQEKGAAEVGQAEHGLSGGIGRGKCRAGGAAWVGHAEYYLGGELG